MFAELKNEASSECECGMNETGQKGMTTSRLLEGYIGWKKRNESHDRARVSRPMASDYHQTQDPARRCGITGLNST